MPGHFGILIVFPGIGTALGLAAWWTIFPNRPAGARFFVISLSLGGFGVVSRGPWKRTPEPSQPVLSSGHTIQGWSVTIMRSLIRLAAVVPFVALPGQELS